MINQTFKYCFAALLITFLASSCKKDDSSNHLEPELITTVGFKLTSMADSTIKHSILFKDLDGPGGATGFFSPDTLVISSQNQYKMAMVVADESDSTNKKDLVPVIRAEGTKHQFFFTTSANLLITVDNPDLDTNGKPLGLTATFTTQQTGRGTLKISLSHYDEVIKDGITPSNETDVELFFPVRVQP